MQVDPPKSFFDLPQEEQEKFSDKGTSFEGNIISAQSTMPIDSKKFERFFAGKNNVPVWIDEFETEVATRQSPLEKITAGLGTAIGQTVTGVIGGTVGMIYGVGSAIKNNEFNKLFNNEFQRQLDNGNEYLRDLMPIYRATGSGRAGVGDQVSEFGADFLGGLSFVASSILSDMAIGAASGGIGLGAKYLTQGAKMSSAIKRFKKATNSKQAMLSLTDTAGDVAKGINQQKTGIGTRLGMAGGLLGRQVFFGAGYESGVEARHFYDEALPKALQDFESRMDRQANDLERKQIKRDVDRQAKGVFLSNMALVGAGNMITLPRIFSAPLKKIINKTPQVDLTDLSKLQGEAAEKIKQRVAKNMGRNVDDLPRYVASHHTMPKAQKIADNFWTIGKTALYEGFVEEGGQALIGSAFKNIVDQKYSFEGYKETVDYLDAFLESAKDTYLNGEGWYDIALGIAIGLVGIPFTKIGGASADLEKKKNDIDRANTFAKNLESSYQGFMQMNFRNVADQIAIAKRYDDAIRQGDFHEAKNAEDDSLFAWAYHRHQAGLLDDASEDIYALVSGMDDNTFLETFMPDGADGSSINQRRSEVVSAFHNRIKAISDSIDVVDNLPLVHQHPELKKVLAYSFSTINSHDEREQKIADHISQLSEVDARSIREIYNPNNAINLRSKYLKQYAKKLDELKNLRQEYDYRAKKNKTLKSKQDNELKANQAAEKIRQLESEIADKEFELQALLKKEIAQRKNNRLRAKYANDVDAFAVDLESLIEKQQKIEAWRFAHYEDHPANRDNISSMFNDLEALANRRKNLIDIYNALQSNDAQRVLEKALEEQAFKLAKEKVLNQQLDELQKNETKIAGANEVVDNESASEIPGSDFKDNQSNIRFDAGINPDDLKDNELIGLPGVDMVDPESLDDDYIPGQEFSDNESVLKAPSNFSDNQLDSPIDDNKIDLLYDEIAVLENNKQKDLSVLNNQLAKLKQSVRKLQEENAKDIPFSPAPVIDDQGSTVFSPLPNQSKDDIIAQILDQIEVLEQKIQELTQKYDRKIEALQLRIEKIKNVQRSNESPMGLGVNQKVHARKVRKTPRLTVLPPRVIDTAEKPINQNKYNGPIKIFYPAKDRGVQTKNLSSKLPNAFVMLPGEMEAGSKIEFRVKGGDVLVYDDRGNHVGWLFTEKAKFPENERKELLRIRSQIKNQASAGQKVYGTVTRKSEGTPLHNIVDANGNRGFKKSSEVFHENDVVYGFIKKSINGVSITIGKNKLPIDHPKLKDKKIVNIDFILSNPEFKNGRPIVLVPTGVKDSYMIVPLNPSTITREDAMTIIRAFEINQMLQAKDKLTADNQKIYNQLLEKNIDLAEDEELQSFIEQFVYIHYDIKPGNKEAKQGFLYLNIRTKSDKDRIEFFGGNSWANRSKEIPLTYSLYRNGKKVSASRLKNNRAQLLAHLMAMPTNVNFGSDVVYRISSNEVVAENVMSKSFIGQRTQTINHSIAVKNRNGVEKRLYTYQSDIQFKVDDAPTSPKKRSKAIPKVTLNDLPKSVQSKVEQVKSNIKRLKRQKNGSVARTKTHYQGVGNKKFARATYFMNNGVVPNDNSLLESAKYIGTQVDSIFRDYFENQLGDASKYGIANPDAFNKFVDQLKLLDYSFRNNNEFVIASGVYFIDDSIRPTIKNKTYDGVAGEVDLITIDNKGVWRIYDMKTMRQNLMQKDPATGKLKLELPSEFRNDRLSKSEQHQQQLSIYSLMAFNQNGIEISEINILPIKVWYQAGQKTTTELDLKPTHKLQLLTSVNGLTMKNKKTPKDQPKVPVIFGEKNGIVKGAFKKKEQRKDKTNKEQQTCEKS